MYLLFRRCLEYMVIDIMSTQIGAFDTTVYPKIIMVSSETRGFRGNLGYKKNKAVKCGDLTAL
jgi:hypothetical protein